MNVDLISSCETVTCSVELDGIDESQYAIVSDFLYHGLVNRPSQAYTVVAAAMKQAIEMCPSANPADLWVHLIYHQFRTRLKRSDQSWKRVAGDAFEHLIQLVYNPRLLPHGLRLRKGNLADARSLGLLEAGLGGSKTDLVIVSGSGILGILHCKLSIAERLTDDVPASVFLLNKGYWSGLATMDNKMFPPPHGDGVVRGELGITRGGDKRGYFEVAGQFSGCYSFNTRTLQSSDVTPSGKRIYSMRLNSPEIDFLLNDILQIDRG